MTSVDDAQHTQIRNIEAQTGKSSGRVDPERSGHRHG